MHTLQYLTTLWTFFLTNLQRWFHFETEIFQPRLVSDGPSLAHDRDDDLVVALTFVLSPLTTESSNQ